MTASRGRRARYPVRFPEVTPSTPRKAAPAERLAWAHRIAEARFELMRIRAYRRQMIDTAYRDADFWPSRKQEIFRLGRAPSAQAAKRHKGAD